MNLNFSKLLFHYHLTSLNTYSKKIESNIFWRGGGGGGEYYNHRISCKLSLIMNFLFQNLLLHELKLKTHKQNIKFTYFPENALL